MALMRSRRGSFAKSLKDAGVDYSEYPPMDGGRTAAAKNEWFFEVAWEVANKGEMRGVCATLVGLEYFVSKFNGDVTNFAQLIAALWPDH
jgi:hypothetical protein